MSKPTINQNKPIICFVEGTIGAGKSTFIKQLQKYHLNAQFFQEPVAEWQNTKDGNGKNVLSYFYEDMSKYCYMFQSYAFITRISQLDDLDLESKDIIFIERSIFSDRNVFAKTCFETGLLNEIEWITYNTWFYNMLPKYQHIFDNAYFIYLQVSPETAMERINKRSRSEENKISIDYLKTLHQKHESWLCNKDTSKQNMNILIDAEKDLTQDEEFKQALEQINIHIHSNK